MAPLHAASVRRLLTLAVAVAVAVAALGACTRRIETSSYGPFSIGTTKEATLAALERLDIRGIEPVIFPPIRLENPKRAELDVFSASSGVQISAEDHPVALHVEFRNDAVSATWPNFGEYPYVPRYPYSGPALLALMQVKITQGLNHAAVFDAIASFLTKQKIVVEAFVVGYAKMRGTDSPPWIGEYRSLLMTNDEWRFEGLDDVLWYPVRQSDVALHFRDGKLFEIVHRASIL
jgi:hypothetical protein